MCQKGWAHCGLMTSSGMAHCGVMASSGIKSKGPHHTYRIFPTISIGASFKLGNIYVCTCCYPLAPRYYYLFPSILPDSVIVRYSTLFATLREMFRLRRENLLRIYHAITTKTSWTTHGPVGQPWFAHGSNEFAAHGALWWSVAQFGFLRICFHGTPMGIVPLGSPWAAQWRRDLARAKVANTWGSLICPD